MIRIADWRCTTPAGDAGQTLQALAGQSANPGPLTQALWPTLHDLIADGPFMPDLVLLATTKADCPVWAADVVTADTGVGGPAELARRLGTSCSCPAWAVSVACASGPAALAVAAGRMLAGAARSILVVACDRLADLETSGFASLQAVDPSGAHPFDADRAGLSLGETAAAIWLTTLPGPGPYLAGWGMGCDANHLTGPSRDGAGLARVCLQAAAGHQPDLVIAHGTGTRYNDDSESLAYAAVCPGVPVVGWKGGLGHSLGSCGLTEAVLAAELLATGAEVPGTQGLNRQGCAGAIAVLPPGPHHLKPRTILSANAGFGGLNAAVLIAEQGVAASPHPAGGAQRRWRITIDHIGWQCDDGRGGTWPEAGPPGRLPSITARQILGRMDASWGRMDTASRCCAALCLLAPEPLGPDSALVLVTERGCAESDRIFETKRLAGEPDPQRFPYTLPSTPLGEASIRAGITGPALCLLGADDDEARAVAADRLMAGAPLAVVMRIESDGPRPRAWAEAWAPAW